MKPYPAYKESGIEWMGEIPEHWNLTKLKWLSKKIGSGITPRGGAEIYQESGIPLIRSQNVHFDGLRLDDVVFISDEIYDSMSRSAVQSNDVLINITGASIGRCTLVPEPFQKANVNQHVCIVRSEDSRLSKYLHLFLCSELGQTQVMNSQNGAAREGLNYEQLGNFVITLPPQSERDAIAHYLDRKTAVIDTLIAKKEQQIALLQEQKTAVINTAVTKGLNPHSPLKDSGIPWLGQIPAHWFVAPLKYVTEIQTGLTLGNRYDNEEMTTRPYLRVANVQDGYLDLETITTIEIPIDKVERYELQFGDVLMTEGGDFDKLGRGFIWEGQIEGCLHQNHVFAVRPHQEKILPHFLAALTTSSHGKNYFTRTSQQTTNLATINKTKLGQFPLLLPPVEEQQEILKHIRQKTSKLDDAIENVQILIDKILEYRTAVISAAVTGKIDVRQAPITHTVAG